MLNFKSAVLSKLIFHKIGNKFNNENLILSDEILSLKDNDYDVLFSSLHKPFGAITDVYHFVHHSDIVLNDLYSFCSEAFQSEDTFKNVSKKIAKHLYEQSNYPQIKDGDLIISYFTEVEFDGIITDAIGIYKVEKKADFLRTYENNRNYEVEVMKGIDTQKIDKSCLIVQTNSDDGLKIISVDRNNYDANYWIHDFLNIEIFADNYQHTKNYLSLTEKFVSNKLDSEFELNKSDKVNLLNKTVDYFKKNDVFEEEEFAQNIFENQQAIDSFKKYKEDFSRDNNVDFINDFSISQEAVKKQSKVFKKIIKLDKNFHVYVHGNNDLIEKGYDKTLGKNFYKIYFDNES